MNSVKKFQRKKEDFVCEQCQTAVTGDGYSNHCPECLTSKHVDIFPGDRLEACHGLMPVTAIEQGKQKIILVHSCTKCKETSRDHYREGVDNFDTMLEITKKINK